jgi:site-specific recombinase XerD
MAKRIILPQKTRYFLQKKAKHWERSSIFLFHRWMQHRGLEIAVLQPKHIRRFFDQLLCGELNQNNKFSGKSIVRYLDWLWANNLLPFDPALLHPPPLPKTARRWIAELTTTLAPVTCRGYNYILRGFHHWLADNNITLTSLGRRHISDYCKHLADRGLHPGTRKIKLCVIRSYLLFLYNNKILSVDPNAIVRSTDFPKLPSYLPRPLPPKADRELKCRLAASPCLYQQALLLMRNTGLRIGELISLNHNCIREDHDGNHFLKVPLGKLKNERLVPLDKVTLQLVKNLQRRGRQDRTLLLETDSGSKTRASKYNCILREVCKNLDIADRVTSHRLRHSFATSMISAGMSLVSVMKLLGHRDYKMTLRYSAITQETVGKEYFDALSNLEKEYHLPLRSKASSDVDPIVILADLKRWLRKSCAQDYPRRTAAIIKRIERLQNDIPQLISRRH